MAPAPGHTAKRLHIHIQPASEKASSHICFRCTGTPPLSTLHTQRHANAVALGVEEAPDLGEVTVEAPVVLIHRGLKQEGIARVEDAGNALFCALDEHAGLL